MNEVIEFTAQEASGLLAIVGTLILWLGGTVVISQLSTWLVYAPPTPRHRRDKDQLRKVYRRSWPGHGRMYVLFPNDVKVVEGRKN